MDPIKINSFAIACLALVSGLSSSPAENQPNAGGNNLLLEPSSISRADGIQHGIAGVMATKGSRHLWIAKTQESAPGLKSATSDKHQKHRCLCSTVDSVAGLMIMRNIIYPNDDSETMTTYNEDLSKVLAQVFDNAAAPVGQQGKNVTGSLVYTDLDFVIVDFDDNTASAGDVSNREEGLEPDTSTNSLDVYLNYPASMLDEVPDLLSFPRRIGIDSSTTTTEDPDTSEDDDTDDGDGQSTISSEQTNTDCPTPRLNKRGKRVAAIKCEENMWNIYNNFVCPFLSDDISGVYGGLFGKEGEFPHAGAVGWEKNPPEDNSHTFLCGSSLINSKYAITAAHCQVVTQVDQIRLKLTSPRPKVVAFGSVNIHADNENKLLKAVISRFISHPGYNPPGKYNDIALIKFKSHVHLKTNIRPACIWIGELPEEHKEGNIIGWGKTETAQTSSRLKSAMVPFMKSHDCQNLLHRHSNRHWTDGIIDSQFCAAHPDGGIDTCLGDSGGPIQVSKPLPNDKNTMVAHVVGVTSFGPGKNCAEKQMAGVYTNITSYLCWIEKEVWPEEDNKFC